MPIGSSHSALYRTSVRSGIEHLPELIEEPLGVPADLLLGQARPRLGLARGVARPAP